jgi:hypothetical protein
VSSNKPSLLAHALAYILGLGTSPVASNRFHAYGFAAVSKTHPSSKHFDPSLPQQHTKYRPATNASECAYLGTGPSPDTTTRCHFSSFAGFDEELFVAFSFSFLLLLFAA